MGAYAFALLFEAGGGAGDASFVVLGGVWGLGEVIDGVVDLVGRVFAYAKSRPLHTIIAPV